MLAQAFSQHVIIGAQLLSDYDWICTQGARQSSCVHWTETTCGGKSC